MPVLHLSPWVAGVVICFFVSSARAAPPSPPSPWNDCETINRGWLYLEAPRKDLPPADEASFVPVDLPHTWNALDTLQGTAYRRDASWYRKELRFAPGDLSSRHFLRFGAAGQQARVFVNGSLCGEHRGGYSAFTLEMTDLLHAGKNLVDVWVSNAEDPDLGPLDADFNFYGGLYRAVQLIQAPKICLSRTTRGGPGIRVWSNDVSQQLADLQVRVEVDNGTAEPHKLTIRAELLDPGGRVVSFAEHVQEIDRTERVEFQMPSVVEPMLWSPNCPTLYQLRVRLLENGHTIDTAKVAYGFRWYRFTSQGTFYLNGKPYDLHGVNRHQDLEGYGNAVPLAHHEHDIRLIKELGANWIRLAHYQQDDYVLELCDRLGLLVWEEVPFINVLTDTPAFRDNYETMLREMIEQHHNHPSIIMWGVQNEILLKQPGKLYREKLALTKHLAAVAREEDPRRVVVQAGHGVPSYGEHGFPAATDVMGYNVYYGWYNDQPEDLTAKIEKFHLLQPDQPLVISEYGAGSDVHIHTETPAPQDFSEEWHVHFLESYLDQFEHMPICGTLLWNMFDFGAAHRGDSIPHVNQKGLIAFDHETKKDAWYLFKARWSDEPVLYLVSPHFTERTGNPTKTYRVLTNFDEVELFHQGRSLGKQYHGFQWEVTLDPGPNQLEARGRKGAYSDRHGFVVTYTPTDAAPRLVSRPPED